MTSAQDYKAIRDAQASLDPEMILGALVWYSVSAFKIDRQEFCRLLIAAGLKNFLPRPPQDSEVFRRVCTATRRNRVATGSADSYANYLVRDVGHDREFIYKRIVRETVNTKDRRLNHNSELCSIVFSKITNTLSVDCNTTDVVARQMASDIEAGYKAERGCLDEYAVRETIRAIMIASNATCLRGKGGGLYFISKVHSVYIAGLEQLTESLPGDYVKVRTHPVIDDKKQRAMLREAYESETVKEMAVAINELTETIRLAEIAGKKVPATKIQPHLAALNGAKAKDKEYAGLLSSKMSLSAARIKIYQALVLKATALKEKETA